MNKTNEIRKKAMEELEKWFLYASRKNMAELCKALRKTFGRETMPHKICREVALAIFNERLDRETRGMRGLPNE